MSTFQYSMMMYVEETEQPMYLSKRSSGGLLNLPLKTYEYFRVVAFHCLRNMQPLDVMYKVKECFLGSYVLVHVGQPETYSTLEPGNSSFR
jgi:hypothetical protein